MAGPPPCPCPAPAACGRSPNSIVYCIMIYDMMYALKILIIIIIIMIILIV